MDATDELARHISRLVRSNKTSSLFVNGAPGSGKSHLLSRLWTHPPADLPRCIVLGPYSVAWSDVAGLGRLILQDCYDSRFLDNLPEGNLYETIHDAWHWFDRHCETNGQRTFLVYVDLIEGDRTDWSTITGLFSSIRHLGATWENRHTRLHHMIVGCWDPIMLSTWYDKNGVSFPYTPGDNYKIWTGITSHDLQLLADATWPKQSMPYHAKLLHELTGGHAAAAVEILDRLRHDRPTVESLLKATADSAEHGSAGQALVRKWKQLPSEGRGLLHDLILKRRVSISSDQRIVDAMIAMGLVRRELVAAGSYLRFPSWYIELLVRLHLPDLGIDDPTMSRVKANELVPEVNVINHAAYGLIHETENMVRNFVAIQLQRQSSMKEHFLDDVVSRMDDRSRQVKDLHQRTIEWRIRSSHHNMPVHLNPLLAYSSTSDLAELVTEIGRELHSLEWQRIGQALRDLAPVRDAVMHNQLIHDAALQRLEDLKNEIYHALSATD